MSQPGGGVDPKKLGSQGTVGAQQWRTQKLGSCASTGSRISVVAQPGRLKRSKVAQTGVCKALGSGAAGGGGGVGYRSSIVARPGESAIGARQWRSQGFDYRSSEIM